MLGKQGDEFAVCRFSFGSGDGAAEDFLLHLEVAAVPCDLDRMAHCPLYAGRRRRKPFGDLRIQHLRYSGDGARTADRKKDPCTQVLKAFNMRRYAHLVEKVGDGAFQMCGRGSRAPSARGSVRGRRRAVSFPPSRTAVGTAEALRGRRVWG